MKSDAKNYFSSNTDPVYTLIGNMQTAYKNGGAAGATSLGFDVLDRVGDVVGTSLVKGTPAAGDVFVKDVLACMSVGNIPGGFSVEHALDTNGLFAVLGGPTDITGFVTSRGTPTYGAEPQAGSSWAASAGTRFLMYGYERAFDFTNETPAASTAFELSTIPTPLTFSPAIAAGVCQTTSTSARLQHQSEILAPQPLSFCSSTSSIAPQQGSGILAVAKRAVSWLMPQPLYAAMFVGGTGGLLSGLSPIGPVTFDASSVVLTFAQQPQDSKLSANPQFVPPIAVQAKTAAGTPLDDVTITLTVVGNNGSFTPPPASVSVAVTANGGIATFPNYYLDKAGGYTITASGSIFGSATLSVTSVLFNIQGQ